MTAAAPTAPGPESAAPRWFFGPLPDLLLGCGLAYVLVFGVHAAVGGQLRSWAPMGLLPFAVLLTGVPHYGATLLRVYERGEDRRAYVLFSTFASAAILFCFAAATRMEWLGALMVTVYLTWSPWHYAGQNYGIALMFLGRRGVRVTPAAKRLLYSSFVFSFLLTALAAHAAIAGANYAPIRSSSEVYEQLRLGIPMGALDTALLLVASGYVASLVGAGVLLLREARVRDLTPAIVIVCTQALWFSIPVLCRHSDFGTGLEPLSVEHAAYVFIWVGIGHSLQYLWVTTWFAGRASGEASKPRYWAKALLAGAAIWIVPVFVFAPGVLGRVPYDAGLQVLIAAAVNIHHFVLDGAIWKLRDGRIARILIRGRSDDSTAPAARPGTRLRPLIYAVGALSVGVWIAGEYEWEFGVRRAAQRGDFARMQRAHERLRWMGQASANIELSAAHAQVQGGDLEGGIGRAERALALFESGPGWDLLGGFYERAGRCEEAEVALRAAVARDPESPGLGNNLAWHLAGHAESPGELAEAVGLAERASAALGGSNRTALDTLAVAYAASGRTHDAIEALSRAIALADAEGAHHAATSLRARLRFVRSGAAWRAH